MYCPNCKKNRTWMSAYKKRQMEPGENPYDFRFFVCNTCEYAHDPKTGQEIVHWRERYYSAESFEATIVQRRKPKGIVDQVLMRHDMMIRAQLQELDMRLDREISMGLISPDAAEMIMLRELQKMGLVPQDFGAESWDDVDWSDPPGDVVRRDDFEWEDTDWNSEDYQAAKAYDFLMDLAEGSATTELESRFILSPRHLRQFISRVGSDRFEFIENIEGFGEGPYPVALDILTPDEVITQTELQLHTIFEAFETVLEGAPNEDDHDQASIGIAGRFKLSNRISINADYFIPIGDRKDNYKNSLAIGIDYETGGHVFQVMLANSQGPYEYTFIENANGDFSSGILYLGFNISRSFTLKGEDEKSW